MADQIDVPLTRYVIAIAESKLGYRSDISLHDYDDGYHVPECRWCGIKKQAGLI